MPYRVGRGNAGLTGGEIKVVTVADPGAGVAPSIPVPAGKIWRLAAMAFTFTTSAAVGDRQIQLIVKDSTGEEVLERGSRYAQVASRTLKHIFAPNTANVWGDDSAGRAVIPLPDNLLLPDDTSIDIEVVATFDAGDAFSRIRLLVEEWKGV